MKLLCGLKGIGFCVLLALCCCALSADYCLSDSNYLRLKVLIGNSLNLTDQQISTLLNSTHIINNSQQIINELNKSLDNSNKVLISQSETISNLEGKLKTSEQVLQKQSQLLKDQNSTSLIIMGSCVLGGLIGGVIIGVNISK